jgi:hypothetical protein
MEGPGRGGASRPDEAVVFHRVGIVVAEVTRDIEDKAEARFRRVKRIALDLEQMAEAAMEWRSNLMPVEAMSGPRAAVELREVEKLASSVERVPLALDWFMRRDGATLRGVLGDKLGAVFSTIREFVECVSLRRSELASKANAFGRQFEADLAADAEHQRGIAAEWSAVDCDGLK